MADNFRGGAQAVSLWITKQKHFILSLYWIHFVHIFLKLFSHFFVKGSIYRLNWSQKFVFTQIFHFSCNYIEWSTWKCLMTRKYDLEHKCEWNLSQLWFFLANVTCYLNCLDTVVHAHPFWALAAYPVSFSALSCWTNRASSMLSSSIFLHTCCWSWLLASDTHCSHGPASMAVDISTSSHSSYICYYFSSETRQLQVSSIILLLLPIRIFQHPQYKCIYTININQVEE
jgi:hypothetical protein